MEEQTTGVEAYLISLAPERRSALEKLRALVLEVV
jgi:hypothetical protein